jgi:hypothetical protein
MRAKLWVVPILLVAVVAIVLFYERDELPLSLIASLSARGFSSVRLPASTSQDLMDIGLVDANGDGLLDIFTTNHNYRQNLWIADGRGAYADRLSAWRLEQSADFPELEVSLRDPVIDKPGVFIYWKERNHLVIRAHKMRDLGPLTGSLRTFTTLRDYESSGFTVDVAKPATTSESGAAETVVHFGTDEDGVLK